MPNATRTQPRNKVLTRLTCEAIAVGGVPLQKLVSAWTSGSWQDREGRWCAAHSGPIGLFCELAESETHGSERAAEAFRASAIKIKTGLKRNTAYCGANDFAPDP